MSEEDLFAAALAVPAGAERDAYLRQACGGDDALRVRVARLLALHEGQASFLDRPPAEVAYAPRPETVTHPVPDDLRTAPFLDPAGPAAAVAPGLVVAGRYTLEEKIGEGGMGEVWAARQSEPVKRRVALKLIKGGADSRSVVARFEHERQALAVMDHPHIARIFDGGLTPTGQPFFVMELVAGRPLTAYCDDNRLTPRERLALFVPVCEAVQHAHQKGVVHRDLKPANILVAEVDGRPVPKVIDFGVAKATAGKLTDLTLNTHLGVIVGTLEYMAPEQTLYAGGDVDTRADIYALGVILYEMLTGVRPHDPARLKRMAVLEVVRVIREEEPARPSTRLSTADALPSLAALRQTEPKKLTAMLRGELDWVVMRCLDKRRDGRYETANGLARDIRRFLADEPVEARPPTRAYRLRKFLRRHRGPVVAVGLLFLALVGGIVGTGIGLQRAVEARKQETLRAQGEEAAKLIAQDQTARAEAEKKAAEAVRDFLRHKLLRQAHVFEQANALLAAGRSTAAAKADPTIRELLDRAADELTEDKIERTFPGQPVVQAAVLTTVGETYWGVNEPRKAIPFLDRASRLLTQMHGGDDSVDGINVLHTLALAHGDTGDRAKAIEQLDRTYAARVKRFGPNDAVTLQTLAGLGNQYASAGQYARGTEVLEKAHAGFVAALGPDHQDTLVTECDLATGYWRLRRLPDAARLLERSLPVWRAKIGPTHPGTLRTIGVLARVYQGMDRYDEAIPLLRAVIEESAKTLGPDDLYTLADQNALGLVLHNSGRLAEAIALLEKTESAAVAKFGPRHQLAISTRQNLGAAYRDDDRASASIAILEVVRDARTAENGPTHPQTLSAAFNLARSYRQSGRQAEAVALLRPFHVSLAGKPVEPPLAVRATGFLALVLAEGGKADEARAVARDTVAARKMLAAGDVLLPTVLAEAGQALLLAGDATAAEPLLRESLGIREKRATDDDLTPLGRSLLGGCLSQLGRHAEAEPLLLAGYQGLKDREGKLVPAQRGRLTEAIDRLVAHFTAAGNPAEAAKWRAERAKYPPPLAPMPRLVKSG